MIKNSWKTMIKKTLPSTSAFIGILCILFPAMSYGADANVPPAQPTAVTAAQRLRGEPNTVGTMTVEEAISQQKNIRKFSPLALDSSLLRQLAWAGLSVTTASKNNTAIELYFCLPDGVYRYDQTAGTLESLASVDVRSMLAIAAQNEIALQEAPCTIVIAGSPGTAVAATRTQARDQMMLDAGKRSQTIELAAISIGLGTLGIDSFDAVKVKRVTKLSVRQEPLYLLTVGYPVGTTSERAARKLQRSALFIIAGTDRPDELFNVMDVLMAANIKITVAQYGSTKVRANNYQRTIEPDIRLQDVAVNDYDAVIVLGGVGNLNFMREPIILNIIRAAMREGKIIGSVGATTQVLVNAGILNGVRVSCERRLLLRSGAIYSDQLAESDQGIITAIAGQQSSLFARMVIDAFKNPITPPPPIQQSPPPATRPRTY